MRPMADLPPPRLDRPEARWTSRTDRTTGVTQKHTVADVLEAIKKRDRVKLAELNRLIEEHVKFGHLSELAQTLDLLLATAGTNEVAGLPLSLEVDPVGWEHMQRMFIQSARVPLDPSHRLVLHPIEGLTEKLGELHRLGVIKLWSFEAFAGPIIGQLLQGSFDSADKLKQFVDAGRKVDRVGLSNGELQAKKFAKETAGTKLDGDIGGKKPASELGPYQWMGRQIQARVTRPGGTTKQPSANGKR